jgi:hypothetical protein
MFSMGTSAASSPTDQERALLIRVARCPLIRVALGDSGHPCREVVTVQGVAEDDRQVPEAWAGNLRQSRVVFISSNPSISMAGQGQPPSTAEAYPVAAWSDDKIVEFLGRRFDQSVRPRPLVRNFRHLQRDGHYAHKPTRFWLSIQRRAEELLGDSADPSRNYAMTEVVHCKSKGETGVAAAAQTCARRYLDTILALTTAPIVAVVGKQAHRRLHERLPHLPEPPYIRTAELGGRPRELVFIWHPAAFQGPKTIAGLHGPESVARLRKLAALS